MSQSSNKGLIFGIMIGTAGVSLALVWYRKIRKSLAVIRLPGFWALNDAFPSAEELHGERGTVTALQGRQLQILEKLNSLVASLEELKEEVRCLKEAIPKLEEHVRGELRGKAGVSRESPHRRKRRSEPILSHSSEETESEGGYLTAPDLESDEEKAPVNKIQTEELDAFLSKVDSLQRSREINRKHILKLLCENEETFGEEVEFIWRLARGYGEVIQNSLDTEEKKIFANIGRNVSEKALHMAPTNGYCQLWYAILCGYMSELEGLQSKLHYAFLFKEHMMKAIELIPEEPQVHYLRGRYCYDVAKLSWIERKMAATIFGSPPTSTIEEALSNFLKAEEIKPGFSKMNYVFLAKCYRDLRQRGSALKYCDCALMLPTLNVEDKQAHQDVEKVIYSLKNK
ncbi:regulator of microtubule dynamics protein 2 isoform X2 [Tachyglossus aculeatus]|uniref:regulator of microtubule dynamics protein 2 isoform X2 n=1 Tax=Tachyglossus aculeatus TaxID=9261 RepID=UPI0018F58043|nr:regulator of microtubule dynamics protein 2 isoform X2 [Tachyglossus aculeatus]